MKKLFPFLLLTVIISSCSSDKTIEDELVGSWLYERETFNSFSTFEDPDVSGELILRLDETGTWKTDIGFTSREIEWDLQMKDSKIAITKTFGDVFNNIALTTIYDITRNGEDDFTFTSHRKFTNNNSEPSEPFEQFENIILTRIK